jgi:KUP system potassium uptake protein
MLSNARQLGFQFDIMATSFFLSAVCCDRRRIRPRRIRTLVLGLARSRRRVAYFRIPSGRAVEVGMQVAI